MKNVLNPVFLGVVSFFFVGSAPAHALGFPSLQASLADLSKTSSLFLSKHDVDVTLGGRVRHESFNFTTPLLLRYDYFDRYTFQRAKFNFEVDTTFGKRTFGAPAVNTHLRITTFNVVDNYTAYTPFVFEMIAFNSKNYMEKAEIGDHQHKSMVTQAYMEEGYIDIKLDQFVDMIVPCALKVGYFSYTAGRGLSLGDYYGGAVDMLGWREEGDIGNSTHMAPGLTLTLGFPETYALQFYYSKWKKESQGPDHTRKEVRARRLDRDENVGDPRAIQRGIGADRDLFALKGMITHKGLKNGFSSYIEPYLVYVRAPELKVEFDADASASLGTLGCMADWSYNGWNINVEAAAQFGHQVMHPIDRNRPVINDAYYTQTSTHYNGSTPEFSAVSGRLDVTRGIPAKYNSHVLLGFTNPSTSKNEYLPYYAYYIPDEMEHVNGARSIEQQGAQIRKGPPKTTTDTYVAGDKHVSQKHVPDDQLFPAVTDGSQYGQYRVDTGIAYYDALKEIGVGVVPNGTLYNADIPFGGATRFREKYTLDYRGLMAMADISYTFPSGKGVLSAALGYIGGDEDPFNTEVDKQYHGFVPLRDANYEGRIVKSYAVLAARRIARPSTFSERLLYAQNNFESSTNLQYFGLGTVIKPMGTNELTIEGNLLHFWEVVSPYMWDKNAVRDFGDAKLNGIWSKIQTDLHFTGYQMAQRASNQLGMEFNTVVTWRPIECIEIRALFATFIPGKLFRDIDGTPNAYAVRFDANGDVHLDSLGSKVPFGGMIRLTYFF